MPTAQEIYTNEVRYLPLAERLRLAALLLDDLQTAPNVLPAEPSAETSEIPQRPRPRRGSGKAHISYIAPDFDAPLEDLREYSE